MHFHSFFWLRVTKWLTQKCECAPVQTCLTCEFACVRAKKREYLQNGSSNPSGKWCNRIFGSFLRRKQLTISLDRADHPKVPLPPLKLPLCSGCTLYSVNSSGKTMEMHNYGYLYVTSKGSPVPT